MRFKGLDLNLLVILDRLLTERNVTRAAEALCLSQSATSDALARLRVLFRDDLLVRVGQGMTLTPRAKDLAIPIRRVLMLIDATILMQQDLDVVSLKREMRIIASDYVYTVFLADAIRDIQRDVPGLSFTFLLPTATPTEQLASGDADFVIMPDRFLSPQHPSQHLFTDDYAAIISTDNELVDQDLDLETFMSLPRVSMSLPDGRPNYEAAIADLHGHRSWTALTVSNFLSIPFMLAGTNRVAIVFARLADHFSAFMPLRLFPSPIKLPPLRIGLQWHQMAESDKLTAYVRNRLLAIGETVNAIAADPELIRVRDGRRPNEGSLFEVPSTHVAK